MAITNEYYKKVIDDTSQSMRLGSKIYRLNENDVIAVAEALKINKTLTQLDMCKITIWYKLS